MRDKIQKASSYGRLLHGEVETYEKKRPTVLPVFCFIAFLRM